MWIDQMSEIQRGMVDWLKQTGYVLSNSWIGRRGYIEC